MAVYKKTQNGTRFAVISQEAMDAIIAYEANEAKAVQRKAKAPEAELAQRKPEAVPASPKASEPRAKPDGKQELFHAQAED